MGNPLFMHDKMAIKWFLNVLIAFLSALYLCMFGGTSIFNAILLNCLQELIWCFIVQDVFPDGDPSVFKMMLDFVICCSGHFPRCSSFHGFNKNEVLIFACMTIMYPFLWLDTTRNFPVWPMCMICHMSLILIVNDMCVICFCFVLHWLYTLVLLSHMYLLCFVWL